MSNYVIRSSCLFFIHFLRMHKLYMLLYVHSDCNVQAYHRELLEHMPPPPPPRVIVRRPPSLSHGATSVKTPIGKKISQKRGRGDKKRHRKVAGGSRDSKTF